MPRRSNGLVVNTNSNVAMELIMKELTVIKENQKEMIQKQTGFEQSVLYGLQQQNRGSYVSNTPHVPPHTSLEATADENPGNEGPSLYTGPPGKAVSNKKTFTVEGLDHSIGTMKVTGKGNNNCDGQATVSVIPNGDTTSTRLDESESLDPGVTGGNDRPTGDDTVTGLKDVEKGVICPPGPNSDETQRRRGFAIFEDR